MATISVPKVPHVLILGAGIGGLALAQALRKAGVSFEIFDRGSNDDIRAVGWCIALNSTTITDLLADIPDSMPPIESIDHLLPLELPAQICVYTGEKKLVVQSTKDSKLIRMNRRRLKEWLSTDIDVQYGPTVSKIEEVEAENGGKKVRLTLSDGRLSTGDVLIGADGIDSQVRKYLCSSNPSAMAKALAIGTIVGEPHLHGEDFEHQLQLGNSAYATFGADFHLFVGLKEVAQDGKSGEYYWCLNWQDEAATKGPYWTSTATKEELHTFALEKSSSLAPRFLKVIKGTSADDIMLPPMVFRDMELDQLPHSRVTLVGDAAHPMVPFRGEGGQQAIRDALKLAKAITESQPEKLEDALGVYQEEMLSRGTQAVKESRDAFLADGSFHDSLWGNKPSYVEDE